MADAKGAQDKHAREKIMKLTTYVEGLKTKLNGGMFGPKHEKAPHIYKAWLEREIKMHSKKIEDLRIKA